MNPKTAAQTGQQPASLGEIQVWIDGARSEAAQVSVLDRGFLYGDSVFETLRTYGGVPFALDEHLARLADSAARVFIDLPVSVAALGLEVTRAVKESQLPECYVRLMVTRGTGGLGLDPGLASGPLRVMLVSPLKAPPVEFYTRGIRVVCFETSRAGDATEAAGAKIGNYLVAVLAHKKAAEAGASEALITDREGQVVEGATSNVFWVKDGVLHTPGLDAGILSGITRAHLLRVAAEAGIPVRFSVPTRDELVGADEVLISSSIREIVPVVQIDGDQVSNGAPGPVTARLLADFRALALRLTDAADGRS